MSIILTHRHFVVYPNGTMQELEWTPDDWQVGSMVSSERIHATIEPGGKYLIKRIVHEENGEYPHAKKYFLEKF
jgi:hypothetical protein